jgi:hypothetical protein
MFFIKNKVEYRENKISLCCNDKIYIGTDICSKCKEHSEMITIKKNKTRKPWEQFSNAIDGGYIPNELIVGNKYV